MKVFISWSGERSRMMAEALSDWLPRVIQAVQPFYSADIEKGVHWSNQLDAALEGTSLGVICLTPENLGSEWIHYEAGALSKPAGSRIWTLLLDLRPPDVRYPLAKFQVTVAERDDVRKLVNAINGLLDEPLTPSVLDEAFEVRWSALEEKFRHAAAIVPAANPELVRNQGSILEEILSILREQERRAAANRDENVRAAIPPMFLHEFPPIGIKTKVGMVEIHFSGPPDALTKFAIELGNVEGITRLGVLPRGETLVAKMTTSRELDDLKAVFEAAALRAGGTAVIAWSNYRDE